MLKDAQIELARAPAKAALQALKDVERSVTSLSASLPARTGRFAWSEMPSRLEAPVDELAEALQDLSARLGAQQAEPALARIGERIAELALGRGADRRGR